jgi:hypothetical protein
VYWGNPQIMSNEIGANNILYWGANALLFFRKKLTDLEFMAEVRPDVDRIWALNRRLRRMFREWQELESREWRRAYVSPVSFPAMLERHIELVAGFDDETLKLKLRSNADLMEAYNVVASTRPPPRSARPRPTRTRRSTPTRSDWTRPAGRPTACSTAAA